MCATADELLAAVRHARRLEFFARGGYLALLEAGTPESRELDASTAAYNERNATLEALAPETRAWRERFSRADTEAALVLARRLESKWFPYLRPSFWRLRRVIERSYNFGVHVVQPTWSQVLETLLHEYDVRATRDEEERRVRARFGIEMQLEEFLAKLRSARRELEGLTGALATIDARTRGSNAPAAAIESLLALDGVSSDLRRALEGFLEDFGAASFAQLDSELEGIDGALDEAPEFFHCLGRLAELPDALVAILRREEWTLPELEGALAASALESLLRAQPALRRFSNKVRRGHLERLDELMNRWESLNAAVVVERVRKRFLERVHRASLPAAQLTDDDKELKKTYSRGRRELEHEFKKTMRYRSIRDLAAEATGLVVRDLKPVWLMSPLSVSDTLPLDPKLFDVVIFDEASQITLEEAVPSIFRARQVIVVGDEMQLPPTSFFATRRSPDDEQLEFEEDGELVQYELDSDSLLTHAARNLSSRLLGWHYRSRSESLISFSNQAFYEGRLNTIPDENLPAQDRAEIVVARPEDAAATAARLLDRAVSFHFVESGVYEKRRNRKEADTIAYLVRELLSREERRTIGIVAFSEAQQGEIDEALERLGRADTEFQTRLEEELEREEDDQFVGLLVKNLENIQGDERDIMILSVCYGYAPDGKMRMNFGPINQSGGEKRLNVAFTRAKHHMAVVSSIRDADITNDYNEGARCLKRYLAYAAAMSRGDLDAATRVLGELSAGRDERREDGTDERDVVREQIAARLAAEGWIVETLVGQSAFRCDLALRRPEDAKHRLGVLIDSRAYYRETDILERDLAKPKLLTIFGWKVTTVLAKDWYEDPEKVLAELRAELG